MTCSHLVTDSCGHCLCCSEAAVPEQADSSVYAADESDLWCKLTSCKTEVAYSPAFYGHTQGHVCVYSSPALLHNNNSTNQE